MDDGWQVISCTEYGVGGSSVTYILKCGAVMSLKRV